MSCPYRKCFSVYCNFCSLTVLFGLGYSEQQPLRLSDAEMEEVIMAVCSEAAASSGPTVSPLSGLPNSQTGKIGGDVADVAASVLIKLLIDM